MSRIVRVLFPIFLFLIVPGTATGAVRAHCGVIAAVAIPAAPDIPDESDQLLDDARAGRATTCFSRLGRAHRQGAGEATVVLATPAADHFRSSHCRSKPAVAHAIHAKATDDTTACARTRAPPLG